MPEVPGAGITVVDNGSSDGSALAVAAFHPKVKLFPLATNRGFTGALAAALAGSSAESVIFLNNDALPEAGWLKHLADALSSAPPDVVAIGGKIIDLTGTRIDFVRGSMTFDGHAFQDGFRMAIGSRPEPDDGSELLFACGGNMIVRRREFVALGAFDESYFAYLEDVDFGWRSWVAGYRVTYAANAIVRHASAATSQRLGDFERGVLFERNALQTALKNYDDTIVRDVAGAIFYTYLHRLHHYATHRNEADELKREPFAGAQNGLTWWNRLRRFLTNRRRGVLASIDDPLTAMQFRAFEWILRNESAIMEKRMFVQSLRKRSDVEIFERFPLLYVATYPGDERMMDGPLFRLLRPALPSTDRKLGEIIRL